MWSRRSIRARAFPPEKPEGLAVQAARARACGGFVEAPSEQTRPRRPWHGPGARAAGDECGRRVPWGGLVLR